MELLVVHGGVLYLHGGGKVGLVSCDGAGGGAVSICDDKSRGNILQGGHASEFGSIL